MKAGINILKATIASLFSFITAPGTYTVKATSFTRVYDEKLEKYKYIVNLKAIASHKADAVKALFKDREMVDISELNGLTMSANIIENEGQQVNLPMRNQEVKITVGEAESRAGGTILVVTNISVPEAIQPKAFSFEDRIAVTDATPKAAEVKKTVEAEKF